MEKLLLSASSICIWILRKNEFQAFLRNLESKVDEQLESINESLLKVAPLTKEQIENIDKKINQIQAKVGYNEQYYEWKEEHLWERLENKLVEVKSEK